LALPLQIFQLLMIAGTVTLTQDIRSPAQACNTWRALYRRLEVRRDQQVLPAPEQPFLLHRQHQLATGRQPAQPNPQSAHASRPAAPAINWSHYEKIYPTVSMGPRIGLGPGSGQQPGPQRRQRHFRDRAEQRAFC
jgi:hypothetical protein